MKATRGFTADPNQHPLSSEEVIDFFTGGGAHTEDAGGDRGRPRRPITPRERVVDLILHYAPAYSIETMVLTLGVRRRRGDQQQRYLELARVVAHLLSAPMGRPPRVSVESVADCLRCTANTVYRLRTKGRQMQRKSPKDEGAELRPSTYWGFRGWIASLDPNDPFQILYAPRREAVDVVSQGLKELEKPPTDEDAELEEAA